MSNDITSCGIRIVDLPPCVMISSRGFSLDEFHQWWSSEDKKRQDRFFPRDFMYYDALGKELIWWYASASPQEYQGKFAKVDFPGGPYAVTNYREGDDTGLRAYNDLKEWIATTGSFSADERVDRPVLFHVTNSDAAFARMKYRQLDLYLPIR